MKSEIKAPDNGLTLALEGKVSLADFSQAISSLERLLAAIQTKKAPGAVLSWMVDGLSSGSAYMRYVGDGDGVESVIAEYQRVGKEAAQGRASPPFSKEVISLTEIIGRNGVTSVRFETYADDSEILAPVRGSLDAALFQTEWSEELRKSTIGSVRGRIQSITSRKSLHFTLYDTHTDKAVSCYLEPGNESVMRKAWGRIAIVSGVVRRHPVTGDPTTVRRIQSGGISLVEE